jgi:hypothetical protein
MSLSQARAAARRDFGGIEQVIEIYREQRDLPFLDAVLLKPPTAGASDCR